MVSFPPLINMLKFSGLSPRGRGPEGRHRSPGHSRHSSGHRRSLSKPHIIALSRLSQHTGSSKAGPLLLRLWPQHSASPRTSPTSWSGPIHISLDPTSSATQASRSNSRRASNEITSRPRRSVRKDVRHTEGSSLRHTGRTRRPVHFLSGRGRLLCLKGTPSPLLAREQARRGRGELPNAPRKAGTAPSQSRSRRRTFRLLVSTPAKGKGQPPASSSGKDASILYRHSSGSGDNTGQCRRRNVRSTGRCIS